MRRTWFSGWLVDKPDPKVGVTPLMLGALRSYEAVAVNIAKIILSRGARPNTADGTPAAVVAVTLAAQSGRAEVLALLIEHGANIDHLAQGSLTQPVWLAAQNGHAKCVAVLVNAAAKQQKEIVDATNKLGKMPCSITIKMGHADVVSVLLEGRCRCASRCSYVLFCA